MIDNRLGANGIIGTDLVAKATPDGYTLLSASTAQAVIAKALQQPEVREKLQAQGGEPSGMTPEQFAVFLKRENAKWGKVVRDSGAKPE